MHTLDSDDEDGNPVGNAFHDSNPLIKAKKSDAATTSSSSGCNSSFNLKEQLRIDTGVCDKAASSAFAMSFA